MFKKLKWVQDETKTKNLLTAEIMSTITGSKQPELQQRASSSEAPSGMS
jgi:hypothetical protein